MVDPLTVTGSCVGLLGSIANLSLLITRFVGDVRGSRKDMDAVRAELSSLSFNVERLRDDTARANFRYPPTIEETLTHVLQNCDETTAEMMALLNKLSSHNIGRRIQWAAAGQGEINKLKSRLEAHKSAIIIALGMASLLLLAGIKDGTDNLVANTEAIKLDTATIPLIKGDITQLLQELARLGRQLTDRPQQYGSTPFAIRRFLDETTQYAESVVEHTEIESDVLTEEQETYYSFSEDDTDVVGELSSTEDSNVVTPRHFYSQIEQRDSMQLSAGGAERKPVSNSSQATIIAVAAELATVKRCSNAGRTADTDAALEKLRGQRMFAHSRAALDLQSSAFTARSKLNGTERKKIDAQFVDLVNKYFTTPQGEERDDLYIPQLTETLLSGADVDADLCENTSTCHSDRLHTTALTQSCLAEKANPVLRNLLFGFGADINNVARVKKGKRLIYGSILLLTTLMMRVEDMKFLLERGANINQVASLGSHQYTALTVAVRIDFQEGIKLLLRAGANATQELHDHDGLNTALHMAIWKRSASLVSLLLSHEPDMTAEANGMYSVSVGCVTLAVQLECLEVVTLLLEQGGRVDEGDDDDLRSMPLHMAAESDNPAMVRCLLKHGANVNRQSKYGTTPLDRATLHYHGLKENRSLKETIRGKDFPRAQECIRILVEHGGKHCSELTTPTEVDTSSA